MFCRNCGAELTDQAIVCMKCGVMTGDGEKFCSNCGAEPDPKAIVCVKCGATLNPTFKGLSCTPQVKNLMQAVNVCFQKYAVFKGRATRSEFWFWQLFHLLCLIGLWFVLGTSNTLYNIGTPPNSPTTMFGGIPYLLGLYVIFLLGTVIPSLAVTVRRLHDIGKNGWFYFIGAIPIIGGIILLVWLCTDSEPQCNKYGKNLKTNN